MAPDACRFGRLGGGAYAQDEAEALTEAVENEREVEDEQRIEEVVVTGSRIRRDEFSSASPIQIIDGAGSRELGLIDTASLLQSATQATGTQINSTFTTFVLDNGPGSAQVNLRGLGAARVLLLLNSRRLATAGVGGAPTSADSNTIPSIMVDRFELLLDGASSIYGSDAVAGVINIIMRKDFEGFEFEAQTVQPDIQAGEENTLSIAWGKAADNWSIGIAGEYYRREKVRLQDTAFTRQCNRYLYEDENGNLLSNDLSLVPGTTISPCKLETINRVFIPVGYGNVWYTPGATNIGIPNFSETSVGAGLSRFNPTIIPTDTDGDGVPNIGLIDPDGNGLTEVDLQTDLYNNNGSPRNRSADFDSGLERINLYGYGDYSFGDENNTQIYFETVYSKRDVKVFNPGAAIFPDVPPTNPYNPCNQAQPNGVNCLDFFGFNFGSQEVTPIVIIQGDRDRNNVEVEQYRFVAGVKGDLPFPAIVDGFGNWSYDAYVTYSLSEGTDNQPGILEPELLRSLNTSAIDASGRVVCGADNDGDGVPDGVGCVPVNLFADSIYQPGGGHLATAAERDYLFGNRTFDTEVEQTIVSAVLQGDLFDLPWNNTPVPLVFGLEYREDKIDSRPNDVAGEGLLFGFFRDGGARGSRDIQEAFLETELQLLEGLRGAKDLSLNLSARFTDESTYGSDTTYSVKTTYEPVEGLTFRGTYGTSFRAPNAREQFLVGQSGFFSVADPCIVPVSARIEALDPNEDATYDPTMDRRSQTILDNCVANGVDPRALGLDGSLDTYFVEVLRRGGQQVQLNIDPETSTSWTYGIVLDQPFWDNFTLRFGATWYDIEVEDSITLLGTQFIVDDCYVNSENNTSAFCRFLTRDADGLLDEIDSSFVNINTITSTGIDYNLYFQKDIIIADRNLDLEIDARVTQVRENKFVFRDSEEDDAGTPIAPEWEGTILLTASYDDVRFNWRANYISGEQDATEDFATNNSPCFGLGVGCRPVAATDSYWLHTTSVAWEPGDWTFTLGMANVFDEEPPLMDTLAPETQFNNVPLGANYDIYGRRMFFAMKRAF